MKKTLSVCLALLMLLSCFAVPTTAFAAAPKKPTVSSVSASAPTCRLIVVLIIR